MVFDNEPGGAGEMPWAQEIAHDLDSLRKLADQLRRMASTADEQVLRAILGKREALLVAIRARMDDSAEAADRMTARDDDVSRDRIAAAVTQIAEMDRESVRLLKERAVAIAGEIEKLRAGKKWRESCPR